MHSLSMPQTDQNYQKLYWKQDAEMRVLKLKLSYRAETQSNPQSEKNCDGFYDRK